MIAGTLKVVGAVAFVMASFSAAAQEAPPAAAPQTAVAAPADQGEYIARTPRPSLAVSR
jgi:hypothetical protein